MTNGSKLDTPVGGTINEKNGRVNATRQEMDLRLCAAVRDDSGGIESCCFEQRKM